MKRKQAIKSSRSSKSSKQPRAIQPRRLAEARGGSAISGDLPYGAPRPLRPDPDDLWQQQHNETLIQLP